MPFQVKIPCEVYSRIVGYLRPTRNWNLAKKQEFKDRVTYKFPNMMEAYDARERVQRIGEAEA
jgi:hypothetical protein